MEVLDREAILAAFFQRLQTATQRVLLLDYDGTLAPFTADRAQAFPYPEVPPLLSAIMRTGTRVVLVTGRPSRELVMLSGLYPHPEIWGSHGLERLKPDGDYSVVTLPDEEGSALSQAADLARRLGLERNLELKPGGAAIHWRGVESSEAQRIKDQVTGAWTPLIGQHSLRLLEFDGGIELRVSNTNKGYAVNGILRESNPEVVVAYLGDDLTDEDAFHALNGRGLTILVRPQFRPTAADLWLKPPEELTEFFHHWLLTCGGES